MIDLKRFRKINKIGQDALAQYLGVSRSFISSVETGRCNLPDDKLEKLRSNDQGWIVEAEVASSRTVIDNNSGVIIHGDSKNSTIDNRHYYSDSPDVLRAQIDLLDIMIKEKDAQIKEKDAQIKEKDAQIKSLLEILHKQ